MLSSVPRSLRRLLPAVGLLFSLIFSAATALLAAETPPPATTSFVVLSDVHYGITRVSFRGASLVNANTVNAALIAQLNRLPETVLPAGSGLSAGQPVGPIDFVAITGDLTNRHEIHPILIQTATASWAQFEAGYINSLTLKDHAGHAAPLLLVPGNHDISNAIGYPGMPETDATSLVQIYNRMVRPATPLTKATYDYNQDRITFSRDVAGVHCLFVTMWPDSAARAWMEKDLQHVPADQPVFIFAHSPPDVNGRNFINPNGDHGINREDRFENLLSDTFAEGPVGTALPVSEQRALVAFLKAHKNIVAYFHGHENWSQFYVWHGPDGDIALNTFRVDSPMKGKVSAKDETKLSFLHAVIDPAAHTMTVRECLWNTTAADGTHPIAWGDAVTVDLQPRQK